MHCTIKKFLAGVLIAILVVPVMSGLLFAASEMPKNLQALSAQQLRAYFQSLSVPSKTGKTALKSPTYTVDSLVEWGKEDLRESKFAQALAFLDYALFLEPNNQKANFWRAVAILGNNPDILKEMQDRKILDANNNFIPGAVLSLPDVINFKKYQGLTASLLDQINAAKNNLSLVNVSFSDQVSDPKFGTVRLDLSAAKLLGVFINLIEMNIHLDNAYDTDFAQLTQNDLGKLTKDNLAKITSDVDGLFADLVKFGYINSDGKVSNLYQYADGGFIYPIAFVLRNRNTTPNQYTVYSWLASWSNSRVVRLPFVIGDTCNTHTLLSSAGASDISFVPATDGVHAWCKSEVLTPKEAYNYFTNMRISITHKGVVYENNVYWEIASSSPEEAINASYPLDAILTHPKRAEIFQLLRNIESHKPSFIDLINFYPTLLASKTTTAAELNAAKAALVGAIDNYSSLSDYLDQRDEVEGVNYAIRMYRSPTDKTVDPKTYQDGKKKHLDDEAAMRQLLTNIKKNLTDSAQNPYVAIPQARLFEGNPLRGINFNLASIFDANRDQRSYIKTFNAVLTKYDVIPNGFVDPTLGGILPGVKAEDLNFLLHKGAGISSATLHTQNNQTQVNILWSSVSGATAPSVISFELYRGTSPDVNRNTGVLVARVDAKTKTYNDTGIDPAVAAYYYRLYTNFQLEDGSGASAYSKIFKVTLHESLPNQPPVLFQIPTRSVNEGNRLEFSMVAVDINNDDVQFTARLANGDPISSIDASIVLEQRNGNTNKASFIWNKALYINGGTVMLVITADDGHGGQATASVVITVKQQGNVDLVLQSVQFEQLDKPGVAVKTLRRNVKYNLFGSVKNIGQGNSTQQLVTIPAVLKKSGKVVDIRTIPGFSTGNTSVPEYGKTLRISLGSAIQFQGTRGGSYELTVATDPDNLIKETKENNNAKKITFHVI